MGKLGERKCKDMLSCYSCPMLVFSCDLGLEHTIQEMFNYIVNTDDENYKCLTPDTIANIQKELDKEVE